MALSEAQIDRAKEEAERYLEYTVYSLCLLLGINPDGDEQIEEIDNEIAQIDALEEAGSSTREWGHMKVGLKCLKKQIGILENLQQ